MKSFAERNPVVVGLVGVALTGVVVLVALNYRQLAVCELAETVFRLLQ